MRSSYIENKFGEVIRSIVDAFKPDVCVELGVLDGYSTIHTGCALKKNGRGHLDAYDLFEDYAYKHGRQEDVQQLIDTAKLSEVITLFKQDAYTVHEKYPDNQVHYLHVDLSNTGDTVSRIMELWDPKMQRGGI